MKMPNIKFIEFTEKYFPLWKEWVAKPHVKNVWFIDGYKTVDEILACKQNSGYDYPFIIALNDRPIGYIQACDLYAYRMKCEKTSGLFQHEEKGTFCFDLFIGEENYLDKGYGTKIVTQFIQYLLKHFEINKIVIDPAASNLRAVRCYEKAGFKKIKIVNDGVADCQLMEFIPREN